MDLYNFVVDFLFPVTEFRSGVAPLVVAAIMAGVAAATGIAKGAATASDKGKKRNKRMLKEAESRLGKMQGDLEHGRGLGFEGGELDLIKRSQLDPVRSALTQGLERNQALLASSGGISGADVSRLRTETSRGIAGAAERAGLTAAQMQMAEKAKDEAALKGEINSTRQEIEDRHASLARRRAEVRNNVFDGIQKGASIMGGQLGSNPENQAQGVGAGSKVRLAGTTPEQQALMGGATGETAANVNAELLSRESARGSNEFLGIQDDGSVDDIMELPLGSDVGEGMLPAGADAEAAVATAQIDFPKATAAVAADPMLAEAVRQNPELFAILEDYLPDA